MQNWNLLKFKFENLSHSKKTIKIQNNDIIEKYKFLNINVRVVFTLWSQTFTQISIF